MKKQKIAVGPGAASMMLIAVVLALSVLTVLTMISARSDESLSRRSVETRQQVYSLFARAEESMARLDAVLAAAGSQGSGETYLESVEAGLPEGMRMEGRQVFWDESENGRQLECGVKLNEAGAFPRAEWTLHRLGEADIWNDEFEDYGFDDADTGEDAAIEEESDASEEENDEIF